MKPGDNRPHYCWIADIVRISGTSREAVISTARLFNHRVVGDAVWFRKPMSVAFADELLRIQEMINARKSRSEKISSDSPVQKRKAVPEV